MRVLQVVASMDPRAGGVSEAVRQLSEAVIGLGCQVEAVTLDRPDSPFLQSLRFPAFGLGPVFSSYGYSSRFLPWLLEHGSAYDLIAVHGMWQYHGFAARIAARRLNIPYVVFPHGMLDSYFKRTFPMKHLKKWLYWPWADYLVLRDAARVCYTAEEERLSARQSFWLYSAREAVVNLGIATPPTYSLQPSSKFYSAFPELNGKRLALFLGRIHQKKGCDLAISAFAKVLSRDPDWHLVMAGPDQVGWQSDLESLARQLNVDDRITFTGMISGDLKWEALQAAEIFFLPSHQENFGVVVAEALACGVPVLISDKINIWREVVDGGAGLAAPDTLDGGVFLLESWRNMSHAQREAMRRKTTGCFQKHFEIRQAAENLVASLEEIISASPANYYSNA